MLGKLFQKISFKRTYRNKELEQHILQEQYKLIESITTEARILVVFESSDISGVKVLVSIKNRYEKLLARVHEKARTLITLHAMQKLTHAARVSSDRKITKRLRNECMHYFEYLSYVKALEVSVIKYYQEALETFKQESIQVSGTVPPNFNQAPPSLASIFQQS